MVMIVLLALAGLFSVESAPSASGTYFVMQQYNATDTNCSKAAANTMTFTAETYFAQTMVAMGAKPGVNCGKTTNGMMSMSSAAGTCTMTMYGATDATCANKTKSETWAKLGNAKCMKREVSKGVFVNEVNSCTSTKPAVGKDMTCFTAADAGAMMVQQKTGKSSPCTSTCKSNPSTCAEWTTAFAGCLSNCSVADKQVVRMMGMYNYQTVGDCKCTAGAPPGATTEGQAAAGSQHMVPSLLTLAMAAVMSNMQ